MGHISAETTSSLEDREGDLERYTQRYLPGQDVETITALSLQIERGRLEAVMKWDADSPGRGTRSRRLAEDEDEAYDLDLDNLHWVPVRGGRWTQGVCSTMMHHTCWHLLQAVSRRHRGRGVTPREIWKEYDGKEQVSSDRPFEEGMSEYITASPASSS